MRLEDLLGELTDLVQELPAAAAKFESTLANIASLNDSRCIAPLMQLLPENSRFADLMFSIIHLIEAFPDDVYVAEVVNALLKDPKPSSYWTALIHVRIFNSSSAFASYRNAISKRSSTEKSILKSVLQRVAVDRPKSRFACDQVINSLGLEE